MNKSPHIRRRPRPQEPTSSKSRRIKSTEFCPPRTPTASRASPAAANPAALPAAASVSAAARCFSSSSSWPSPPMSSTSSSVPKPPTTPSTTRSASTTREAARWRSTTRTSAYATASGLSFTSRATMSRFSPTFQQRYVINFKYWGGGAGADANAPIFVCLGAEGPLDGDISIIDFLTDNAARFNALLVYIEVS
ncbi:hypothetical protein WN944_004480 [Citrus x changshan-huyou]|uniref:Uncharacterized protein n=1 Tax=Citrus x changshan-huyou TaxID=2935761 RepID=A0AAP0M1J1_9ROSI